MIIPIDLTFASGNRGGDFNGSEKVTDTLGSPLFQGHRFPAGHTQLLDANQRGEFFSVIKNGYHLLLNPSEAAPVKLTVPADKGQVVITQTGVTVGIVDIRYWSSVLKTATLQTPGLSADMLPIFLSKDVYLYFGNPNNCWVLGYHGAYKDATRIVRIVVAPTRMPSFRSSPWIRKHPHLGFSLPSRAMPPLCHEEGRRGLLVAPGAHRRDPAVRRRSPRPAPSPPL